MEFWRHIIWNREGAGRSLIMAEAKQGTEKKIVKKTPHDFIFGKFLGEGSFSTVCILPFVLNHALKEYVLVFVF